MFGELTNQIVLATGSKQLRLFQHFIYELVYTIAWHVVKWLQCFLCCWCMRIWTVDSWGEMLIYDDSDNTDMTWLTLSQRRLVSSSSMSSSTSRSTSTSSDSSCLVNSQTKMMMIRIMREQNILSLNYSSMLTGGRNQALLLLGWSQQVGCWHPSYFLNNKPEYSSLTTQSSPLVSQDRVRVVILGH